MPLTPQETGSTLRSMAGPLDTETQTYERLRAELLGRARGKYVLIKGERIVDVFASYEDAISRGYQEFGLEPFMVKQVLDFEIPRQFASFNVSPS
jgi:hypothetical protein